MGSHQVVNSFLRVPFHKKTARQKVGKSIFDSLTNSMHTDIPETPKCWASAEPSRGNKEKKTKRFEEERGDSCTLFSGTLTFPPFRRQDFQFPRWEEVQPPSRWHLTDRPRGEKMGGVPSGGMWMGFWLDMTSLSREEKREKIHRNKANSIR